MYETIGPDSVFTFPPEVVMNNWLIPFVGTDTIPAETNPKGRWFFKPIFDPVIRQTSHEGVVLRSVYSFEAERWMAKQDSSFWSIPLALHFEMSASLTGNVQKVQQAAQTDEKILQPCSDLKNDLIKRVTGSLFHGDLLLLASCSQGSSSREDWTSKSFFAFYSDYVIYVQIQYRERKNDSASLKVIARKAPFYKFEFRQNTTVFNVFGTQMFSVPDSEKTWQILYDRHSENIATQDTDMAAMDEYSYRLWVIWHTQNCQDCGKKIVSPVSYPM